MARTTKRRVAAACALGYVLSAQAAFGASTFELPGDAFWGGWDRGDPGTLFAEWRQFDAFDPDSFEAEIDLSPDGGSFNTDTTAVIPASGGGFITGTGEGGNIYSINGVQDFDVVLTPTVAPPTPLNVALQVKTIGETLDPQSVLLSGSAWDERRTIETTDLGEGPFGGTLLTEVYVWYGVTINTAFAFDLTAAGTSLSLDELAVDVGPAGEEPPPPPAPAATENVPLPAPALAVTVGLVAATGARRHGDRAGR